MRICLTMVVRDEPKVIRRALESALPFIDCWAISFNGIDAATPAVIEDVLGHLPGKFERQPWVNYGTNRTSALRMATSYGAGAGDIYALMIDADEIIDTSLSPDELRARLLGLDGARVTKVTGTLEYPMILFTDMRGGSWRYSGAVHESIVIPEGAVVGDIREFRVLNQRDGAGSEIAPAVRYAEEAALLEARMIRDPSDARAAFYYAQSLELAGEVRKALHAYEHRISMGGWQEEVFIARLRRARILQTSTAFLEAWEHSPHRAEPLVDLAGWYRRRDLHVPALMFAEQAQATALSDVLFVEPECYGLSWRVQDELALAQYNNGLKTAALCSADEALKSAPEPHRTRIQNNRIWFRGERS